MILSILGNKHRCRHILSTFFQLSQECSRGEGKITDFSMILDLINVIFILFNNLA